MFYSCSQPQARAHPLNAIAPTPPESQEDRIERHRRMCRRLAELGMDMAEAAARKAATSPRPGGPDPSITFSRAAAAVRQAIKAEAGIGAAPRPVRQKPDTARPSSNPRPALPRQPAPQQPRQQPRPAKIITERAPKPAEDPPFPLPCAPPAAPDLPVPAAGAAKTPRPVQHPPPLPSLPNPPPVWQPPPQPKAAYPPAARYLNLGALFER